jgi:hypothetical protein
MFADFFIFEGEMRDKNHIYLKCSSDRIPGRVPYVTLLLIKRYITHKSQSDAAWRIDKELGEVHWDNNNVKIDSLPINYSIILNNIKQNWYFKQDKLKLFIIREPFLDVATCAGLAMHSVTDEGEPQVSFTITPGEHFMGENYPVVPMLKSEGIIIGSFLNDFLNRIALHRQELVNSSNQCFSMEWFFKFRDVINDSISSLEIMLNLVYSKAEFDLPPTWVFNQDRLGLKYNRRFKDKLRWISEISGKDFNIEKYKKSLYWLQELRNHLNHFDPPSFCITFEQCAQVLNAIVDVGMVHLAMRKALGLYPSTTLINFVLQPEVIFIPEPQFIKRATDDEEGNGYNTCRWPVK